MKCTSPLKAYRGFGNKPVFKIANAKKPIEKLQLPCGQCIGCKLKRSAEWAARCQHEAWLHDQNCFITLTYHDRHLPDDGSLDHRHFQKFMKDLRNRIRPTKVRYFMCGEYGEKLQRPHFHALLFGYDFADKELWRNNKGNPMYTSDLLSLIWGRGFCTVGELNYGTAAYVAKYCTKKITGKAALQHYVNEDGVQLKPEYARMSTGSGTNGAGGIGKTWLDLFEHTDVWPADNVPVIKNGKFGVQRVPRYYDKKYGERYPAALEKVKEARIEKAEKHSDDNSPGRLKQIAECNEARLALHKRNLS